MSELNKKREIIRYNTKAQDVRDKYFNDGQIVTCNSQNNQRNASNEEWKKTSCFK